MRCGLLGRKRRDDLGLRRRIEPFDVLASRESRPQLQQVLATGRLCVPCHVFRIGRSHPHSAPNGPRDALLRIRDTPKSMLQFYAGNVG